jgi:hypothetical protein
MKFRTDDVVDILELDTLMPGDLVELVVTGQLYGGAEFTAATDCIRLVPPGAPPGMMTVQSSVGGSWIDVSPLDEQLDGGGFAAFARTYPLGSWVTLTAPPTERSGSLRFVGWTVNGVLQGVGDPVLQVVLDGETTVKAVYRDAVRPISPPINQVPLPEVSTPRLQR